jgi:hypothetical protein
MSVTVVCGEASIFSTACVLGSVYGFRNGSLLGIVYFQYSMCYQESMALVLVVGWETSIFSVHRVVLQSVSGVSSGRRLGSVYIFSTACVRWRP